jgi:hypothetical protein
MIRTILGFFLVYGALGTLDIDPSFSELAAITIVVIGLAMMYSGVKTIGSRP